MGLGWVVMRTGMTMISVNDEKQGIPQARLAEAEDVEAPGYLSLRFLGVIDWLREEALRPLLYSLFSSSVIPSSGLSPCGLPPPLDPPRLFFFPTMTDN